VTIVFASPKIRKLCNDKKIARKKLGARQADILRKRLDDPLGAPNLDAMRHLAGRFHALRADRRGQYSLDLEHPQRLIFEPADDPLPRFTDGSVNLRTVLSVRILEIADTHG